MTLQGLGLQYAGHPEPSDGDDDALIATVGTVQAAYEARADARGERSVRELLGTSLAGTAEAVVRVEDPTTRPCANCCR